jgi:NAD-dependent dihydropyrimidine dehydrogenase PreA subunit
MTVVLCHVAPDDAFASGFRQTLAGEAGVEADTIIEIRHVAERALHPDFPEFAALAGQEIWIGCRRPRAIRALLAHAGIRLDAATHWMTDTSDAPSPPGREPGQPWYPVIESDRCRHCDQCRQFCLFGVYAKNSTGKIEVAKPLNCKPGCPACARICPAQAIIFPFCPETPINGGEPSPTAVMPAPLSFDQLAARRRGAVSRETLEAALARRAAERRASPNH